MFVTKRRYNELQMELDRKNAKIEKYAEYADELYTLLTALENKTVPKGNRLTEEELHILIAVDFLRMIRQDIRNKEILREHGMWLIGSITSGLEI